MNDSFCKTETLLQLYDAIVTELFEAERQNFVLNIQLIFLIFHSRSMITLLLCVSLCVSVSQIL